jgi:stress-induced morphogen
MDHFIVRVISVVFKDKSLLDRHRLVYRALNEPMSDGRIHALEIQAQTNEEASEVASTGLKIQN